MTAEGYEVARLCVHCSTAVTAIAIAYCKYRRKWQLGLIPTNTLALAWFVCLESLIFPAWFWIVATEVPIREEGLAVLILHVLCIGSLALLGAVLSSLQARIRWTGVGLCLSFLVFSPLALLLPV